MKQYEIYFQSIETFKQLGAEEKKEVFGKLRWRRYTKGESIIAHQEESSDAYFLGAGRVRATIFSESGKEISYQDLGPGKMFGEMSAIDKQPRSTHVMVLEDSVVASMSSDDFWQVMNKYPSISASVMMRLVSEMRLLCNRVFEFGALNVKHRVYHELLRLAECSGGNGKATIENMPSHCDIASRIMTHREAVTRVLSDLQKAGVIAKNGSKQIVIPDTDRLREML